ncbi:MAG TPA: hypothetical protein VFE23_05185 [Usitatibacter sp.]|nr:hypothetical protein [Usitatibacter sp.]
MLAGCAAPSALIAKAAGVDRDEIPSARGSWDNELLGIHLIVNFSHIREGNEAPAPPYVPVFSLERDDWSERFEAPESVAGLARAWFDAHGNELRRQLETMVARVHERYPGEGGRRFRIIVLPAHSRFDGAWPVVAASGHDLPMTFALTLPASPRDGESMIGVNQMLYHEFSHSYFWFHREHYRNNFSDEVVAYIEQGCLAGEFSPGGSDTEEAPIDKLAAQFAGLAPDRIYARYHGRYADSLLAYFAALHEMDKYERGLEDPAARELCRSLPTAGRDFTKPS